MFEDYKILIALLIENTQCWKIIDLRIESWEVSKVRKEFDKPGAKFYSRELILKKWFLTHSRDIDKLNVLNEWSLILKLGKTSNNRILNCNILDCYLFCLNTHSCWSFSDIDDFFEVIIFKVNFEALPSSFYSSNQSRVKVLYINKLIVINECFLDAIFI